MAGPEVIDAVVGKTEEDGVRRIQAEGAQRLHGLIVATLTVFDEIVLGRARAARLRAPSVHVPVTIGDKDDAHLPLVRQYALDQSRRRQRLVVRMRREDHEADGPGDLNL